MPKARPAANAFTASDASAIVGMSVHMLNYLAREGYLVPTYVQSGRRGKTRYYSYRDLVIARVVQKLLDAGLEIRRLKNGIRRLRAHPRWRVEKPERALRMLATDGSSLFFPEEDGTLIDLTRFGQLAFSFVLDIGAAQADVKKKLRGDRLANFSLYNRRLRYA